MASSNNRLFRIVALLFLAGLIALAIDIIRKTNPPGTLKKQKNQPADTVKSKSSAKKSI